MEVSGRDELIQEFDLAFDRVLKFSLDPSTQIGGEQLRQKRRLIKALGRMQRARNSTKEQLTVLRRSSRPLEETVQKESQYKTTIQELSVEIAGLRQQLDSLSLVLDLRTDNSGDQGLSPGKSEV